MARDTLANAKSELVALFGNAGTNVPVSALQTAGVAAVYKGEPLPGDIRKPLSLTVATVGTTAVEWLFSVRLYASADDGAIAAQDRIDSTLAAIDGLLEYTDGFGPLNWQIGWDDEIRCFVAVSQMSCGRNDL